MSSSVTWVQDENGNYEISSTNHLLQLMHTGSLFTDEGTPPSSYLEVSYVQTADIDLAGTEDNITPITVFRGSYDGQGYSINNWSYTGLVDDVEIGLFGRSASALLANIVLGGVWVLLNGKNCGFLVGSVNTGTVYNISTNFLTGTRLVVDDTSSSIPNVGGLIGFVSKASVPNLTVGGTIDEFSSVNNIGGIVGSTTEPLTFTMSHVRNIATFSAGIVGTTNAGGFVGNQTYPCTHIMNAMTGDIVSTGNTGGVFGTLNANCADTVVSLQGNITTTGGTSAAGIAGYVNGGKVITRALNYMTGDVQCGLCEIITATLEKCVVALRGTTTYAGIISTTGTAEILLDTSNEIVAEFTNDTVTTMDLSSFEGVSNEGLPFFSFGFTDPGGNSIDWDFQFGHYLPYSLAVSPLGIDVTYISAPGAIAYTLTIEESGESTPITVKQNFTEQTVSARGLIPDTSYTLKLYKTVDDVSYTLYFEAEATTLSNLGTNYDVSYFLNDDGIYDISGTNQTHLQSTVKDLFVTGDNVLVSLPTGGTKTTKIVNDGDSLSVAEGDAFVFPFFVGLGTSQTASLILSDNSTTTFTFDETNETISVGDRTYSPGDIDIIDGKKVSVMNID